MQAIQACVAATVRRDLKEPVAPIERLPRKGNFPVGRFLLLTYLWLHFYSPVMSMIRTKFARGNWEAQETRNRLRSANQATIAGRREIPQPETLANSDTSDHRSSSGSVQTTTNGRLGNADFGLSAPCRTQSVSRECIPGMDNVSVMWSPLESKDGPGRHSGKDGTDNRSTSTDTSLPRMCIDDANTTDDTQNGDVLRMQSGHPCAKEWYTHLSLRNHVFHRLRTHVQQLSPWRSR